MASPLIVAISGPTSAGKTYFTRSILEEAQKRGIASARISTDNFYHDLSHLPMEERTQVNYDHPSSIDKDAFIKVVKQLNEGQSVELPTYDFKTHTRKEETITIDQSELIIIEGIFSLSFKELLPLYTVKIFIDLESDLRFIRRVKRDTQRRGRSIESVINQYLDSIRPTQVEYVMQDRNKADMTLTGNKDHTIIVELILNYTENRGK